GGGVVRVVELPVCRDGEGVDGAGGGVDPQRPGLLDRQGELPHRLLIRVALPVAREDRRPPVGDAGGREEGRVLGVGGDEGREVAAVPGGRLGGEDAAHLGAGERQGGRAR